MATKQPAGEPSSAERRVSIAIVGLILLLALALRLSNLAWQLPWQLHPDEGHYVWKAADMVQDGNLNPKYFRNPSFFTYLLFVQFKVLDLLGLWRDGVPFAPEIFQQPSLPILLGRLTGAFLGVGTVAVVFRLGLELVGRTAALLGALLLGVSFLHVRDSHFATNDVPATFFLALSVLCSAILARRGRARDLLLAALFGGLATSTKYNAGFFVVPLMVAYGQAFGRTGLAPRRLGILAAAGAIALLAYLVGTPFTVLAWPTFQADFQTQQRFARDGWEGQGPEPISWLYLSTLGDGLGWVTVALAAIGFGVLTLRRPGAAAILGGYPLVYLAYMLGVKLFFARFAVPVLPFVCLAAAHGVVVLSGLGARSGRQPLLLGGLTIVAAALPLVAVLRHDRVLAAPDTRVLAYQWLEDNVPPGSKIVVDEYTVRDRRPRAFLPDRARFDLDIVNALGERELEHYRQQGYRYAVVSSFQYLRFPGRFDTYPRLEREARLVASFEASAQSGARFDIEDLYSPFHVLAVSYDRPGPTVKIYELAAAR